MMMLSCPCGHDLETWCSQNLMTSLFDNQEILIMSKFENTKIMIMSKILTCTKNLIMSKSENTKNLIMSKFENQEMCECLNVWMCECMDVWMFDMCAPVDHPLCLQTTSKSCDLFFPMGKSTEYTHLSLWEYTVMSTHTGFAFLCSKMYLASTHVCSCVTKPTLFI